MRLILTMLLTLILVGCATTSGTKTWHVHPDDMAQFNQTTLYCQRFAAGSRYGEALMDRCIQNHGYRLEITN